MKTKILILGGDGFIGWNLCKQYAQDDRYEVYASRHVHNERWTHLKVDNIHYLPLDLTNKASVEFCFMSVRPDIVLHCAAVTTGSKDVIENPQKHVVDNIIMNTLVFDACHRHKVARCLFLSCSVMYQSSERPQKESDWKIEDTIYPSYYGVASMKIFSERMCEFYSRQGVCKFTVLRLSNVFGPGDKTDLTKAHFFPSMVKKICEAGDTLEVWGKPEGAKRDLIFVDDVVALIVAAIDKQQTPYELFNCGVGVSRTILEVINTIRIAAGKKSLEARFDDTKPSIPTVVCLDTTKAKEMLGWEPSISFEVGVRRTVEWYQAR